MIKVLVIAEHDENALAYGTLNVVGAAAAMSPQCVDVAVLSASGAQLANAAATIGSVSRVLLIERTENTPCLAAVWAPQVAELARNYTHVFAPASTFGKDLMPRAAALTGCGALSDVTAINGPYHFERPVYAGNAVVKLEADSARTLFATIRTTAFDPPDGTSAAPVEATALSADLPTHTRFVERLSSGQTGPDLQTANIVVAGGRGLGGPEGVNLIERLAEKLGAAVGGSRAAVDSGWMANDLQVGQTGKIIAPDLYIGIGISGAIQHLTGIKDANTIVAINKDSDAPICALADIVLVADLFAAVPALIASLDARQSD
jgi:electron transfer flavoprotein alpha subunit